MAFETFKFLFVNTGFLVLIFYMVIAREIKQIKDQWPLYRCNPSYMILADNVSENYKYCISQTSKTSFNKLSPALTSIQDSANENQYKSNATSVKHMKAHNKFGKSTNFTVSDLLKKSGKIKTVGTIFMAHTKGILDKLNHSVTSLHNTMKSGVSGISVLNNKFANITSYINRL